MSTKEILYVAAIFVSIIGLVLRSPIIFIAGIVLRFIFQYALQGSSSYPDVKPKNKTKESKTTKDKK